MENYEKLLELFKNHLRELENEELEAMVDGMYIFNNELANLHCRYESLFKINSFPRNVKRLLIEMEISTYQEINRRK